MAAYIFSLLFAIVTIVAVDADCASSVSTSGITTSASAYSSEYSVFSTSPSTSIYSITPNSTTPVSTATRYAIISPSSCRVLAAPTGTAIGHSSQNSSSSHAEFQYQQYPNSQFIVQNATSAPIYVDLSNPDEMVMSDSDENTLIMNSDGTFVAFVGTCELEIGGRWKAPPNSGAKEERYAELENRQISSVLCAGAGPFCKGFLGAEVSTAVGWVACYYAGAEIGAVVGEGIGWLGVFGGPVVAIATVPMGMVLGARLGAVLATDFGNFICSAAAVAVQYQLCLACNPLPPQKCGPGDVICTAGGACQDALSDPNNCGKCANVCPSGACTNGVCTQCGAGEITCNGGACQDGLTDPNNCGACGNVCSSGTCSNGACVSNSCTGETCSTFTNTCGPGGTCTCSTTTDGTGFCVDGSTLCDALASCDDSSNCASGQICAVGSCCERNVCVGATICGGSSANKRSLMHLNRAWGNGTFAGFGSWSSGGV